MTFLDDWYTGAADRTVERTWHQAAIVRRLDGTETIKWAKVRGCDYEDASARTHRALTKWADAQRGNPMNPVYLIDMTDVWADDATESVGGYYQSREGLRAMSWPQAEACAAEYRAKLREMFGERQAA